MPDYNQWAPTWWNPAATIPTATPSPQTEFLEAINRVMPYVSPYDMSKWGTYLYSAQPQTFGYAPSAGWTPSVSPQDMAGFDTAQRHQQVRNSLFGSGGAIDLDSPVRQWLDAITSSAQEWAPGSNRVPGSRRTRGQQAQYEKQMNELVQQPTQFGVTEAAANLWKPWVENYIAPTTQRLSTQLSTNAPDWMQSSILGPKSQVKRGSVWGNSRWL